MSARAGVYVHFPWCLAKCPYCDFVSYAAEPSGALGAEYADAVLRELAARAPLGADHLVSSVFFGGGTPSLWAPPDLGRVLSGVRQAFEVSHDVEVTVECNPSSLDEERARSLAERGVNRLSIGVQSLDDERLRFLGRLHDADGAIRAVRSAIRSGIGRVSADLIFGLPGQSPAEAAREALALVDLGLSHVSCYQLTIEQGTRFGELARRGRLPLADDAMVADAFLAIDEELSARGFAHYEISNYARPGQEARHNLAYWRGDPYLGVGCAAYGFVRRETRPPAKDSALTPARGVRWRNATVPKSYVELTRQARVGALGEGDPLAESSEGLDAPTLLRERIMLGLRMESGLDLEAAARELGTEGWTPARAKAANALQQRGRVVREGGRMRIPRSAWIWADDTASRLI